MNTASVEKITVEQLISLEAKLASDLGLVRDRLRRMEVSLVEAGFRELSFTKRQREVLTGLLTEQSNKEIGAALCIAERTVKYHVGRLMQKTGARDRHEVVTKIRRSVYEAPLFPHRIDTGSPGAAVAGSKCPSGPRAGTDADRHA